MLILCVFSGSYVGSKWWLLCSFLHPAMKHLNCFNRRHLVFPCTGVDTIAESSQLTRGGSKVRWPCQSTIVGGACTELHHSNRSLRTAWFEKGDFKLGLKKYIFIIIGKMCTRTLPKYVHVQTTCKVNFASDDPCNWWTEDCLWTIWDAFISCLDSHSDSTHSLQRIHLWATDVITNLGNTVKLGLWIIFYADLMLSHIH